MLRCAPVKKLSAQRMTAPSASKRSQRCEPRNPAPPVIRTRFSRCIHQLCSSQNPILFSNFLFECKLMHSVYWFAPIKASATDSRSSVAMTDKRAGLLVQVLYISAVPVLMHSYADVKQAAMARPSNLLVTAHE